MYKLAEGEREVVEFSLNKVEILEGVTKRLETIKEFVEIRKMITNQVDKIVTEAQDKRMQEVSEDLVAKGGEIKELAASVGKVEDALEKAGETLQKAL